VVSSQAFDRITSWKIAKQMEWLANGLQMILRMSFADVWRKQFLTLRTYADWALTVVFKPVGVRGRGLVQCPGAGRARSALTGFASIYSGMSSHERELVLINILGASRLVEIAARLLVTR
jgi:hypothetical protein